ncbi:glycerate kinase [Streptomyces sp. NPDC056653]|uniref:glycerate kinase n=1 Tax=Streptomyces sp. NPDC056653 TaxID=3345894 RepID=UPI00368C987B
MADGGEGTIDALRAAGAVTEERRVTGPLGQPVTAEWARLGGVHYVESAQACGISRAVHGCRPRPVLPSRRRPLRRQRSRRAHRVRQLPSRRPPLHRPRPPHWRSSAR